MGLEIVSLLLIYASELYRQNKDESVQKRWSAIVWSIADALIHVGATGIVPRLDIALLTLEPFQQTGLQQSKLDALKSVVNRLVQGSSQANGSPSLAS